MSLSEYTILVVDIIPTDMLLLTILLKQMHFRVLTATDEAQALEQARQLNPDLILLDIYMPQNSGFKVAEILQNQETTRHIPILYIVDMGEYPIFTPEGQLLSQALCIERPFDMRQLLRIIFRRLKITQNPII